jgi:hypothetical protein
VHPGQTKSLPLQSSWPRALRNRFVHLELEPDFEDWSRWAVKAGIRPEILALLRFKPALLFDADATSDQNAWPTPRSWEMASSVLAGVALRQGSSGFAAGTEIEATLLEGTIGRASTVEFVAFLRLFRQLLSIPEILLNPDTAPVPEDPSALPTEMRVLAMRDAAVRDRAIAHTPEVLQ